MTEKQLKILDEVYKNKTAHTLSVNALWAHTKEYGISRKAVSEYLKKQPDYQILQSKKKEKKNATMVRFKPGYIQCDTIDISNLKSPYAKYLITFVDVYSRKLWAYGLVDKSAPGVLEKIKKFLDSYKLTNTFQSDNGKEFEGELPSYLKELKIKQIKSSPGNPTTNAYVEKNNHRLARALYGYKQKTGKDPIPDLQDFIDSINLIPNATTKVIPEVAILPKNQQTILDNVKKYNARKGPVSNKLFLPGDKVRVLIEKSNVSSKIINQQKTAKGYVPKWTNEIYTIKSRSLPTSEFSAPYYYLEEFFKIVKNEKTNEEQKSYKKFYQSDLLKIDDSLTQSKTHVPKYNFALDQPEEEPKKKKRKKKKKNKKN